MSFDIDSGSPDDRRRRSRQTGLSPDDSTTDEAGKRSDPIDQEGDLDQGRSPGPSLWSSFRGPGGLRILIRIFIFLAITAAVYTAFSRLTLALFGPDLEVVRPITPSGPVESGSAAGVGAVVRNSGTSAGRAFVVAILPNGEEVEGSAWQIPAGETAQVVVPVTLGPGEHVLSLVVFDAWRDIQRLETLSAVTVGVTNQAVEIRDVVVPERASWGDTVAVRFVGTNPGQASETVTPAVAFMSEGGGRALRATGDPVEIGRGMSDSLVVHVDTGLLSPQTYFVRVFLRSAEGDRIGQARYPLPIQVSPQ